jgi:hypothetical protein
LAKRPAFRAAPRIDDVALTGGVSLTVRVGNRKRLVLQFDDGTVSRAQRHSPRFFIVSIRDGDAAAGATVEKCAPDTVAAEQ